MSQSALLTDKEYAGFGGCRCPVCKDADVGLTDSGSDGPLLWNAVRCGNCRATWREEFVLTGFLDLKDADGNPIEKPKERQMKQPDNEQAAAVVRFARQHGGRWKADLHVCWMNAAYPDALEGDRALLQQVRNQFGPLWLEKVMLKDLLP